MKTRFNFGVQFGWEFFISRFLCRCLFITFSAPSTAVNLLWSSHHPAITKIYEEFWFDTFPPVSVTALVVPMARFQWKLKYNLGLAHFPFAWCWLPPPTWWPPRCRQHFMLTLQTRKVIWLNRNMGLSKVTPPPKHSLIKTTQVLDRTWVYLWCAGHGNLEHQDRLHTARQGSQGSWSGRVFNRAWQIWGGAECLESCCRQQDFVGYHQLKFNPSGQDKTNW